MTDEPIHTANWATSKPSFPGAQGYTNRQKTNIVIVKKMPHLPLPSQPWLRLLLGKGSSRAANWAFLCQRSRPSFKGNTAGPSVLRSHNPFHKHRHTSHKAAECRECPLSPSSTTLCQVPVKYIYNMYIHMHCTNGLPTVQFLQYRSTGHQ